MPVTGQVNILRLGTAVFALNVYFLLQLILLFGGIPYVWGLSGALIRQYGFDQTYEVMKTLIYMEKYCVALYKTHVQCFLFIMLCYGQFLQVCN